VTLPCWSTTSCRDISRTVPAEDSARRSRAGKVVGSELVSYPESGSSTRNCSISVRWDGWPGMLG
jgi:hypothetical protein